MKHTRKYILSHGTHSSICHIQNTPIKHICKGGAQGSSSSPQDSSIYSEHTDKSHFKGGIKGGSRFEFKSTRQRLIQKSQHAQIKKKEVTCTT
ncbi:tRNA modification GTPase MnmE [Frankliniella fusca]|uniref:tRNA modification GTPase MnmE n=1 Tax=Frankliniella fusca TaxID=407009 RepID=A0AAE1LR95_9NEOP|nr:tRNA modification GTPase MnmE [Frankliniella fusca]